MKIVPKVFPKELRRGWKIVKKKGVGGRPKTDRKKREMAIKMYESKLYSIKEIIDAIGVSKTSLYRYLKKP